MVIGSALGGWDGRRGWIYHVATIAAERRKGLGTRLVRQIEEHLQSLGCRKVNAIVQEGNRDGAAFWKAVGYEPSTTRHYGRQLEK
jgi:GNAT superfamily N-acetyltransferase